MENSIQKLSQTLDGFIDKTAMLQHALLSIMVKTKNSVPLSKAEADEIFEICSAALQPANQGEAEECPHDEHDHGICLDCEKDITNDLIGKAEAAFEGDR